MSPRRLLAVPLLAAALVAPALLASSGATAVDSAPLAFRQYHAPDSPADARGKPTGGDSAGEPSLGVDPKTGEVLFQSGKSTLRVTGFGAKPDSATWTDVTDPVEGAQTSDPILWRDTTTGRTFVNQLELQGGSLQAFTDDNGKNYTRSTMGGGVGLSFDHQSVVTGIPAKDQSTLPKPVGYPNYVYYCTNDLYAADCSVSIDGGLNFGAQLPVYTGELAGGPCAAIFGHLKTDPRDGTVYLPPNGCNGKQMVFTSTDNTLSWTGHLVPGSTDGDAGHPSLDVGRQDGALYYAWGSADGFEKMTGRTDVAVSLDKGKTWTAPIALGKDLGVVTSRFPVVVAGDKGRAAVAFLGAKADGDPNAAPDPTDASVKAYDGVWDLYVSITTDGGQSWTTTDATPDDPVQRGPVCTRGTTCLAGRNLLDFNDMVLDADGHVAIALADGALGPKDNYTKALAKADIVRQVGGPSLYTAAAPGAAAASGSASPSPSASSGALPLPVALPASSASPSGSASAGASASAAAAAAGSSSPSASSAALTGSSDAAAATSPSGSALPRTGPAVVPLLLASALLAGGLLLRRRRRAA